MPDPATEPPFISAECHARAPIHSGDEGGNYCTRPAGHDGDHIAPDHDLPWYLRQQNPRVWSGHA